MKVNDLFPSKYLRASDLDGDTPVTMKNLVIEEVNGEHKPVLYFEEKVNNKNKMVVNKTNAKTIGNLHGQEVGDWIGQRITLFPTEVDFRGDIVDAIRVRKRIPAHQGDENSE